MTDKELDNLERLANAATKGPWKWSADDTVKNVYDWLNGADACVMEYYGCGSHQIAVGTADADFIAAARTAVPELIAEVRRLRTLPEGKWLPCDQNVQCAVCGWIDWEPDHPHDPSCWVAREEA